MSNKKRSEAASNFLSSTKNFYLASTKSLESFSSKLPESNVRIRDAIARKAIALASPLESTVKLYEVLQISWRISTKLWQIHREMSAANRQKNIRTSDATAWNTDSSN